MNVLEFDQHHTAHQDASGQVVRDYLTSNGWVYTSRHPGSIWMWSIRKRIPGTLEMLPNTYVVNESTALQWQRYWELEEQHFNAHDEHCRIFKTFDWDDCNCMPGVENDTAALDGDGDPT
jgi:hypothetical protein